MARFDDMKLAVELLSGGKNTVLFDDLGLPSIYVVIPKGKISDVIDGGSQNTHHAFIVDGVEKERMLISKYQNIVMNDRAYSLAAKDPKTSINFDQAKAVCENKGRGFHLMTNAEWAYIALWSKKNKTMPRGNNSYGKDHSAPHEKGVVTYYNGTTPYRVATGTGPASWSHDWTNEGIFDLNGNIYEWVLGLRLVDGEIQIIPYNNAAMGVSHDLDSTLWKAIMPDGILVEPGTSGTLKFDYTGNPPGTSTANFHITDEVVNKQTEESSYGYKTLESLTAKSGIVIPEIMKALAIAPIDEEHGGDVIFFRNNGERVASRGGNYNHTSAAGVICLSLNAVRSYVIHFRGLRCAFVDL